MKKTKKNNKKENGYKGEFYTKIPNKILQPLLMINLPGYEIRILLAIVRKTYGFNKDKDHINQNQLKKLTGIEQPHISRALKSLLEKKMITKKGKILAIQNCYKFWEIPEKETLRNIPEMVYFEGLKDDKNIPEMVYKYTSDGIKNIPEMVYTKNTIKKTIKEYSREDKELIKEIVNNLNDKTKKNFRSKNDKTKKLIKARLNEGYILDDFKKVIDIKTSEWLNTEYNKFLRPITLFGTKFESYLNESKIEKVNTKSDLRTKQADDCYKNCDGDCIVIKGSTIRRYPYCDQCKKLSGSIKRNIPEGNIKRFYRN